jgi:hypothetical protein
MRIGSGFETAGNAGGLALPPWRLKVFQKKLAATSIRENLSLSRCHRSREISGAAGDCNDASASARLA